MSIHDENWSRKLCKVLRHCALDYGFHMSSDGFVSVNALLAHNSFKGLTVERLKKIVDENEKSRFTLRMDSETGELLIRAAQGHSIPLHDDLLLKRVTCRELLPKITVHATTRKKCIEIFKSGGLCAMKRNHIHLVSYPECLGNGSSSQIRASSDTLILVDVQTAFDHGISFFWSTNNVLLTPGAPDMPGWLSTRYLKGAITRSGKPIELSLYSSIFDSSEKNG
ncbi:hypothetical protein PNEG_01239 [Pneumocystis murina B123]|uniref:2'-phosphotransferase n=1 Tax=Pneumocystis murina (strain B123) TaxID=1069680 RepID=M7P9I4_PNEMU|nr:hypothetical protein PNEG_01239 [Pneumocystis murina B123]EMR10530.1 hypothetical protein PNEG_01239 [Pneumocystis murina B123]